MKQICITKEVHICKKQNALNKRENSNIELYVYQKLFLKVHKLPPFYFCIRLSHSGIETFQQLNNFDAKPSCYNFSFGQQYPIHSLKMDMIPHIQHCLRPLDSIEHYLPIVKDCAHVNLLLYYVISEQCSAQNINYLDLQQKVNQNNVDSFAMFHI